jgi:hypothetical protein|uniref:Uncharacterized protein n=1 Tax=viral metagenome TaxID=1070528 RepID=A0A6C0LYW1_9ZZZZ
MTFSIIPEGIITLEPLSIIFLILVQIGGRYLKIELTPAQQKIINNVVIQSIILFAIILMATKNIANSLIIVCFTYLCINILFNENHKYNILSKKWLIDENIISGNDYKSLKDIYINNISRII